MYSYEECQNCLFKSSVYYIVHFAFETLKQNIPQ